MRMTRDHRILTCFGLVAGFLSLSACQIESLYLPNTPAATTSAARASTQPPPTPVTSPKGKGPWGGPAAQSGAHGPDTGGGGSDGHDHGHNDDDGHGPGPGQGDDDDWGDGDHRHTAAPAAGTASVGEPCARRGNDDDSTLCLALKYVVYQDTSSNEPVIDERDVADNVRAVNTVWRDCGIQFQVDQYLPVVPEDYRLRFRTANYNELTSARRHFMDDRTLLVVTTGTWNRSGQLGSDWANAWTSMPGERIYGSVLEASVARNANVIAHELGHYLNLGHDDDPRDLMHPLIYRNSDGLTRAQCSSARNAANKYWKEMTR
jgi:hypothetical protein